MLLIVLKVIFVLVCLFLILVILLQSGKGGDVAAAFGGSGSQTAFGPRGAQKPLEKATAVAAALFMLMALLFALPGFGTNSVVRDSGPAAPAPSPAANNNASVPVPSPTVAATATPEASPSVAASPKAADAKPAAKATETPAAK